MSANESAAPVVLLEWDSRFFGKRIARVQSHCLSALEAATVDRWCSQQRIDCLYYLADGADPRAAAEAEKDGYHLVDLRVTFTRDLTRDIPAAAFQDIRRSREEDLAQLRKMTRANHTISRFFADTHFDPQRSAEMYEIWIENDLKCAEGQLWVKTSDDLAVAYTSARIEEETAEIGLVGVDADHRRKGYGAEVVLWTLKQLALVGVKRVDVVTQGSNIAAQNLYEKCGFVTKSIDLWYHKWF